MKERPILFSGPMVNAILEGRKTQTRRTVKPQPIGPLLQGMGMAREYLGSKMTGKYGAYFPDFIPCPYGGIGDQLWVRETSAMYPMAGNDGAAGLIYRADGTVADKMLKSLGRMWKPSIFMRRHESRITLEIAGIRVERLQEITLLDICREGLAESIYDFKPVTSGFDRWRELWGSINGPGSWAANPFVWVVEFKRI